GPGPCLGPGSRGVSPGGRSSPCLVPGSSPPRGWRHWDAFVPSGPPARASEQLPERNVHAGPVGGEVDPEVGADDRRPPGDAQPPAGAAVPLVAVEEQPAGLPPLPHPAAGD